MKGVYRSILVLLMCVLLFASVLFADERITILEVDGFGISQNEAVQNGLIQALKQAKGVTIDSQKTFIKMLHQKSSSTDGRNTRQVNVEALNEGAVREATQGLISEYRILESQKIGPGEWEVKLAVKMQRYQTPGISPDGRRKIAIIPFRMKQNPSAHMSSLEVSRQFAQQLVNAVTQTRKFTVLDREYMDAFLQEKNLILSSDAPTAEQMKIGEVLGVDYLLVGTITEANIKQTHYKIQVTGEEGYNSTATFIADYRIIVMASRQIKWSDSVMLTFDDAALRRMASSLEPVALQQALLAKGAKDITNRAMANIYPLSVVKVQSDGDVILNQGADTVTNGEVFDVYNKGEQVIDPYTQESLGASEEWIAKIKITRVIPKMSYASVIEGNSTTIKNGSICRRSTATNYLTERHPGRKTDVKTSSGGGVVLPFD